jgi:Protein of unknown function (DUF2934)
VIAGIHDIGRNDLALCLPDFSPDCHEVDQVNPTRKNRRNSKSPSEVLSSLVSLQQQIAERAYYKAAARGFEPGGELEDWLTAEAEIRSSEEVYLL